MEARKLARLLTDALNPFVIFTALYAATALSRTGALAALGFLAVELLAAGAVVGYVLLMRRRRRVGAFWMPARAERIVPAVYLLCAFVALLLALALLGAPRVLLALTLSMGLAAAFVAALTLFWKASAHCTVAGHAAAAGPVLLGPPGLAFLPVLALVLWARLALRAHTLPQSLAGASIGALSALILLP